MGDLTESEVKEHLEELDNDELIGLLHKMGYRRAWLKRAVNDQLLPESCDDPVFKELDEEAWVEVGLAAGL